MSKTKIVTAAAIVALLGLAGYEFAVIHKTKASAASLDRERVQMPRDLAALKHGTETAKAPPTPSASVVPASKSSAFREHASTAAPDPMPPTSADPQRPVSHLATDEARALTVASATKAATDAYHAAHNGQEPPNLQALIPYFATPQEGADYVEYLEAQKAAVEKEAKPK